MQTKRSSSICDSMYFEPHHNQHIQSSASSSAYTDNPITMDRKKARTIIRPNYCGSNNFAGGNGASASSISSASANNSQWGFNTTQSEHMMNIVAKQLYTRLEEIQHKIMDLEWNKNLRRASKFDSRKEYLKQLETYWLEQEINITAVFNQLADDITFWAQQLQSQSPQSFQQISIVNDMCEKVRHLHDVLEFIKNDKGSLQEALDNITALSLGNGSSINSSDTLEYLREICPRQQ